MVCTVSEEDDLDLTPTDCLILGPYVEANSALIADVHASLALEDSNLSAMSFLVCMDNLVMILLRT
ncbi:hypothetical protein TorRG33x02_050490 [Trema orientale]|uniref:Uncharacterized protein n=1 Tax=Trema orientale TaxID=63057 RepID=A0A2P5FN25_TREOI|nr:hypothetical protein TorRG33x02_050490 [Trema orientale]